MSMLSYEILLFCCTVFAYMIVIFINRVVHETNWKVQVDPSVTCNKMVRCFKKVTKDALDKLIGGPPSYKHTSCWNEEVKTGIKIK